MEAINEVLSRASDAESATIGILLEIQENHTTTRTKLEGYQTCDHCGGDGVGCNNSIDGCGLCGGSGFRVKEPTT